MLHCLISELQQAEDLNEDVFILGHIAPGNPDVSKYWSAAFYKIVQRYEDVILGQFYGHSHRDEFKLFYKDEDTLQEPINVAYLCPSVTPYLGLNPGFRLYEIDSASNRIVNHYTWIMDLPKSNKLRSPQWRVEYDALSAYEMPSLTPSDWNDLTVRLETELPDDSGDDML
jgi:sphingomyelin phosphodiesterase